MKYILALFTLLQILSCQNPSFTFVEIDTHSKNGGESNLNTSANGTVYLSWIEYLGESEVALMLSQWQDNEWSSPQEVSRGDNWFVNWADFPSITALNEENTLAAHWLQKSAEGTYDYDVRVSQSHDNGINWTNSFVLHNDSISAEHGFVSMIPLPNDRILATWLDGRNTKSPESDQNISGHDHGHHGAMSLRAAEIDRNSNVHHDMLVDERVCDCCQTSSALTDQGPVVVYRDRSEEEIRDIYISRLIDGKWSSPVPVYNDNWHITGCPVNGPVVRANENEVAVAWFTMADEVPQVNIAFSSDSGANFDLPLRIDNGAPLGRIDLLYLSDEEVFLTWLEQVDTSTHIMGAHIHKDDGVLQKMDIVSTSDARSSGFPRITDLGKDVIISWTSTDSITSVKTGLLSF